MSFITITTTERSMALNDTNTTNRLIDSSQDNKYDMMGNAPLALVWHFVSMHTHIKEKSETRRVCQQM